MERAAHKQGTSAARGPGLRLLAGLAGLVAPLAAGPLPPAAAEAAAEVTEALERAAVEAHVEEWPELTLAARDLAREKLDAPSFARLVQLLAEAYAPRRLIAAIASRLRDAADPESVDAFLAWHRTPLGAEIIDDREHAGRSETLRTYPRFLAELRTMPDLRLEALRDLDAAIGLSENIMAVALSISLGVARGSHLLRCAPEPQWSKLERQTRVQVLRLRKLVEKRVRVGLAFTHQALPLRDLRRFERFTRSGKGRWLHQGLRSGLASALAGATVMLETQLASDSAQRCAGHERRGTRDLG